MRIKLNQCHVNRPSVLLSLMCLKLFQFKMLPKTLCYKNEKFIGTQDLECANENANIEACFYKSINKLLFICMIWCHLFSVIYKGLTTAQHLVMLGSGHYILRMRAGANPKLCTLKMCKCRSNDL